METRKVKILRNDDKIALQFELKNDFIEIILGEESPTNIKSAFNFILHELKDGIFSFILTDEVEDLYSEIAKEYLKQLNQEMEIIYKEIQAGYNTL